MVPSQFSVRKRFGPIRGPIPAAQSGFPDRLPGPNRTINVSLSPVRALAVTQSTVTVAVGYRLVRCTTCDSPIRALPRVGSVALSAAHSLLDSFPKNPLPVTNDPSNLPPSNDPSAPSAGGEGGSNAPGGSRPDSKAPPSGSGKPPTPEDDLIAKAMEQVGAASDKPGSDGRRTPGFGSGGGVGGGFADEVTSLPPDLFPGYQLLRELRRGGQGVVYQALHKGTKRKVAIKVLREGPFASTKERARFEREIEILAQLNHPNIVTIHDSGITASTTSTGATVASFGGSSAASSSTPPPLSPSSPGAMHYFVMDYISGQSLDSWLAGSKRSLKEVLDTFTKICDAINSAHLKGIIHRDLKPSNIRVDANNEPHILDFGLAKSAGDSQAEAMTMTGDFLGSLHWASPEQAEGAVAKIDVRTDVYSIGVMMYHALTGRFPYAVIGNVRDVLDNILKSEPARPSTTKTATRVRIDDEVETIVLKCLSKERERRYQNAGELGKDLRNYLGGQPIEAKRDSGWYVIRKMASRHRATAGTAIVIAVAVLGAAIISTVFWRRAEAARAVAQQREATTSAYAQFLEQVFTGIDPDTAQGRDITVMKEVLWNASQAAATRFKDQPETLADVHDVVGQTYAALGQFDLAEAPLTNAMQWRRSNKGQDSAEYGKSLHHVAMLRFMAGKNDLAKPLAEDAVRVRRFAAPNSADLADSLLLVGMINPWLGEFDAAKPAFDEALALRETLFGKQSEPAGEVLASLGQLFLMQKKYDEAEPPMRAAIAAVISDKGEDNVAAAISRRNLAGLLRDRGRPQDLPEARDLLEKAVASLKRLYGPVNPNHPMLSLTVTRLAQVLQSSGDLAAAERLAREALDMRRTAGASDFYLGSSMLLLGELLIREGRLDDAGLQLDDARRALTPSKQGRPGVFARLARWQAELSLLRNQPAKAAEFADECLAIRKTTKPPVKRDVAEALLLKARAFALDESKDPTPILNELSAIAPEADQRADASLIQFEVYRRANQWPQAWQAAMDTLEYAKAHPPLDSSRAKSALRCLLRVAKDAGHAEEIPKLEAELKAMDG
jgi:eukaryotic-like serine/threonine-protein kinase